MTFHPRERRRMTRGPTGRPVAKAVLPRRDFLRWSAYGVAVAGLGPSVLAACGDDEGAGSAGGVKLSRPDDPATLPTFDDIEPIADGLAVESGTLKVFNYEEYIAPEVLAGFEQKHGVKVEVTTFTSMDEAVAKLSSGQTRFDVFFPTVDVVGKLAAGKLLQPLNKSYLSNIGNVWDSLQDPFYDQGGVYTAPYVLFTTGLGYRVDAVATAPGDYDNPYDALWDPANRGQVFVLEDDREVFGMAMLRAGGDADINTEDAEAVETALAEVLQLTDTVNVKIGAEAYTVLPEKRTWLHQCWSGDVINAQYYLPEGEVIENIGYWYPSGGGVVGSDTMAVMAGADRPVLAHAFIDHLLDSTVAFENYGWLGYQPPQSSLDPETVVADEYVPEHLATAVVRPEDFDDGHQLLQLSLQGEKLWDDAWSRFTAGA